MRAAQKVVWSEGLLMSPQHLQQQDLFHEALLSDRLDAIAPVQLGRDCGSSWTRRRCPPNQMQLACFQRRPAGRRRYWPSTRTTPKRRRAA